MDAPDFVTAFPHRPFPVAKDKVLRPSIERLGQGPTYVMPSGEFVGKVVESGAEVVEAVPNKQCLKGGIPDIENLRCEAEAWCEERNRLVASVDWRFTIKDAHMKLR